MPWLGRRPLRASGLIMAQCLDQGHLMYLKAQMLIQSASRIRHQHVELRFARVHLAAPFEHFVDQLLCDTLATGTRDGIDGAQVETCFRYKDVLEWFEICCGHADGCPSRWPPLARRYKCSFRMLLACTRSTMADHTSGESLTA
jgi:hypothetical protein